MIYDYIFCDLDGTILDGEGRHYDLYFDIVKKYGGKPISQKRYWQLKRARVSAEDLLKESEFCASPKEYLREWRKKIEEIEYLKKDKLFSDSLEFLNKIKSNTKKLCLITMRNNCQNLFWQLEFFNIRHMFDEILVASSSLNKNKYDLVKDYCFANALVIGDSEADAELALKLGVNFIGVTCGVRDEEHLVANVKCNNLLEIIHFLD